MIKEFPIREKGFSIYVLDDYAVHLMAEIRQALFKKGYVFVIIGGEITSYISINNTNCHHRLNSQYGDLEMKMLEQFEKESY